MVSLERISSPFLNGLDRSNYSGLRSAAPFAQGSMHHDRPNHIPRYRSSRGSSEPLQNPVQSSNAPAKLLFFTGGTDDGVLGARTPNLLENLDYIERLPFDGLVIDIPAGWSLMSGRSLSYRSIYNDWLAPLEGQFQQLDHNFLRVQINDPGDLFDDRAWDITINNWGKLARAAYNAGMVGIFFDTEEYGDPWLDYRWDYDHPIHSRRDYYRQAQLRGQQIMNRVLAEHPDLQIIFTHGPYISEPDVPTEVRRDQFGVGRRQNLFGSFYTGFLTALDQFTATDPTTEAQLIDGGEFYQYRTHQDFRQSYEWRKYTIASPEVDSEFISEPLRSIWSNYTQISFGIYNLGWPQGYRMNPAIAQRTLTHALDIADDYVWFYAEADNWLVPGGVSRQWIHALRQARHLVDESRSSARPFT